MPKRKSLEAIGGELVPTYASRELAGGIAKNRISDVGMAPRVAYQAIHDELRLDGFSLLNLATFVTTWMEPEAKQLMAETLDKNMIDKDEYPQTAEIEKRCVNILADLWHVPGDGDAVGTSTIGSSEACMLGGMAMKWRWRDRQRAAGKPTDRPNLVMGANTQICWHKFCRYWDVEPREVSCEGDRFILNAEEAVKLVDENTIGVVAILGSTFDGSYEPVAEIAKALDSVQEKHGWDIPIHVDGASGAFVAPFIQPDLEWDFRIARVKSINTSGHKYGLVYPGVGWVAWRSQEDLPEDLVFHVNYLGGDMPTFTLNFSRAGNQVVGQYYNFLRLGRAGYTRIMEVLRDTATWLSGQIIQMGHFELLSDGSAIPVFAFSVREGTPFSVYDISDRLRERGWQVPAYTMPEGAEDVSVLRVVVREGFSRDMATMLLDDLKATVEQLEKSSPASPTVPAPSFAH